MQNPMESSTGSPVEYPEVTINGRTYTVKFSMLAQLVLDRAGIDTRELNKRFATPGPGSVALFMDLFASGVAHHFVAAKQKPLTAEEWALEIGDDPQIFSEICRAVRVAMGKVRPSTAQAPRPAASETERATEVKPN